MDQDQRGPFDHRIAAGNEAGPSTSNQSRVPLTSTCICASAPLRRDPPYFGFHVRRLSLAKLVSPNRMGRRLLNLLAPPTRPGRLGPAVSW